MKSLKLLIIFFTIAAAYGSASAAEPEALFKQYRESWTMKANGSQEYRCYKELQIYTHTAMNETYGETFIRYNPEFQQLIIHDSYTVQTDGNIVRTPGNAFVEVLPKDAADMPAYTHLKEMVVVHTGLELGATIVLDYSIVSKPGYLKAIDVCRGLQQSSPVREYSLSFSWPSGTEANYRLLASKTAPRKSASDGQQRMEWTFHNLPALSKAPGTKLQNGDIPGLLFHTYPSSREALDQVFGRFDNPESLKGLADEITGNCRNASEKMHAIHNYVMHEIAYCPLDQSATAFHFRPAKAVIRSAYASELEKVNLLNGLLNAAGIKAVPAAGYALDAAQGHCGLAAVKGWAVLVENGDRSYRLTPLNTGKACEGCCFFLRLEDGKKIGIPSETKALGLKAGIILHKDKAEADIDVTVSDNQLDYRNPNAQNPVRMTGAPRITHCAAGTVFSGKSAVPMETEGSYRILHLPETQTGLSQRGYARYNSRRSNNLYLPALFQEESTCTVSIPGDMEICTQAATRQLDNRIGSLSLSIGIKEGKVLVHRSIRIKERLVRPSDYPLFLQLVREWDSNRFRQLLFKTR